MGNNKYREGYNYGEAYKEFLRVYGGKDNAFLKMLEEKRYHNSHEMSQQVADVFPGFIRYLEKGLSLSITPEHMIQIETVSDYMDQANTLLSNASFHPAAAAVLIGASLEEFLRVWCEAEGIQFTKPSIDNYAKGLYEKDMINKQDIKDITAWGSIRNDAAHGNWDLVSDKNRVRIMLDGVNLFMRVKTVPK